MEEKQMKVASIPTIFIIILLALGEAVAETSEGPSPSHVRSIKTTKICDCYSKPGDFMPKTAGSRCVISYCDTSPGQCIEPGPLTLTPGSPRLVGLKKEFTIPDYWCDADLWREFWEAVAPAVGGNNPSR
jgi:hypothetical protein